MYGNIVFLGGVHGVGKSSICKKISRYLKIEHLSSGHLLQWQSNNQNANEKLVSDIHNTQNRLIQTLRTTVKPGAKYLLDGHLCLLNKNRKIEKVPYDVFKYISPVIVSILVSKAIEIQERLLQRDNVSYSLDLIQQMQQTEVEYGRELAEYFNIPFLVIESTNYQLLIKLIDDYFENKRVE
jgi:adenylate kinase